MVAGGEVMVGRLAVHLILNPPTTSPLRPKPLSLAYWYKTKKKSTPPPPTPLSVGCLKSPRQGYYIFHNS